MYHKKIFRSWEISSADNSNSTLRRSFTGPQGWFALSAYAFPTEVVNGLDGYTILRLAAEADDGGSKPDSLGPYVLWQCSSSNLS